MQRHGGACRLHPLPEEGVTVRVGAGAAVEPNPRALGHGEVDAGIGGRRAVGREDFEPDPGTRERERCGAPVGEMGNGDVEHVGAAGQSAGRDRNFEPIESPGERARQPEGLPRGEAVRDPANDDHVLKVAVRLQEKREVRLLAGEQGRTVEVRLQRLHVIALDLERHGRSLAEEVDLDQVRPARHGHGDLQRERRGAGAGEQVRGRVPGSRDREQSFPVGGHAELDRLADGIAGTIGPDRQAGGGASQRERVEIECAARLGVDAIGDLARGRQVDRERNADLERGRVEIARGGVGGAQGGVDGGDAHFVQRGGDARHRRRERRTVLKESVLAAGERFSRVRSCPRRPGLVGHRDWPGPHLEDEPG